MARRGSNTMTAKIMDLAAGGGVIDLDAATLAVFGREVDQAHRDRINGLVSSLVAQRRLRRAGRGRFQLEEAADVPETLPPDEDRDEIPAASPANAALAHQLNTLAMVVNQAAQALHYEIGETRRLMNLAQAPSEADEQPTGFRLSNWSSSSTVTVRRREP